MTARNLLTSIFSDAANTLPSHRPGGLVTAQQSTSNRNSDGMHFVDVFISRTARKSIRNASTVVRPMSVNSDSSLSLSLGSYELLDDFGSKYLLLHELGSGASGFTVACQRIEDGLRVAVKFIYKSRLPIHMWKRDRKLGSVVPMEVFMLNRICHPNIIRFFEVFEDNKFFYVVTELVNGSQWHRSYDSHSGIAPDITLSPPECDCIVSRLNDVSLSNQNQHICSYPASVPCVACPAVLSNHNPFEQISDNMVGCTATAPASPVSNGLLSEIEREESKHLRNASFDLFEYIEQTPFFAEHKIKLIFKQIAFALHHLHSNNIVHNDIKDENIVIDSNLCAKLIDFGSARFIPTQKRDYMDSFPGSMQYTPPELLQCPMDEIRYRGPEVDVWCLGVLLYFMTFACPPFESPEAIVSSPFRVPRFKRSDALIHLIDGMLCKNPELRFTMDHVICHPWLVSH